jgi:hypothetical protein
VGNHRSFLSSSYDTRALRYNTSFSVSSYLFAVTVRKTNYASEWGTTCRTCTNFSIPTDDFSNRDIEDCHDLLS